MGGSWESLGVLIDEMETLRFAGLMRAVLFLQFVQ